MLSFYSFPESKSLTSNSTPFGPPSTSKSSPPIFPNKKFLFSFSISMVQNWINSIRDEQQSILNISYIYFIYLILIFPFLFEDGGVIYRSLIGANVFKDSCLSWKELFHVFSCVSWELEIERVEGIDWDFFFGSVSRQILEGKYWKIYLVNLVMLPSDYGRFCWSLGSADSGLHIKGRPPIELFLSKFFSK